MYKMDHKMQQLISDHPWSSLSTITTFDIGNENDTNQTIQNNMDESSTEIIHNINIIDLLKAKASTPISLLVESLVQQLCSLLEPDSIKATKLYNVICKKLYDMKLIDESYSMEEFEVMRSQYQRALYQLVGVAKDCDIQKTIPYPIPSNGITLDSRYNKEFIELEFLGGGGFGRVYKARNRLDGSEYAVKKICICAGTVNAIMTHLKEVKTFAILNHPNVVQYKAAWLEPFINNIRNSAINELIDTHSILSDFDDVNSTRNSCTAMMNRSKSTRNDDDSSDFEIEFVDSDNERNSSEDDSSIQQITEENQLCCIDNEDISTIHCTTPDTEWVMLYIQMALCQQTLKQWLEERNKLERQNRQLITKEQRMLTVREIFRQLVCGLNYIHSKGIVHHDIKPSNVFISCEGDSISVQLGDFGLACPLDKSHTNVALGTHLYAAPEQLEGKCDVKSDIFSLGIILLELIESFVTDMERVHNITELRKGRLAAHISADHPQLAHIMSQLVFRRPAQRPDASTILEMLDDETKSLVNISNLQRQLKDKDAEIARLKALLQTLGINAS